MQLFALHAALNGFDHQTLHIDSEDLTALAYAPSKANREPPATRSDVGDRRPFSDAQRIHHLIGFLPRLTIWRLEQPEILRIEQPRIARRLLLSVRVRSADL